jgi:hypothetical protein
MGLFEAFMKRISGSIGMVEETKQISRTSLTFRGVGLVMAPIHLVGPVSEDTASNTDKEADREQRWPRLL